MNEMVEAALMFVVLLFLIGLYGFSVGSAAAEKDMQNVLSEQGMKYAIFNNIIAAPCTNNNYGDHTELRKLIVDSTATEKESQTAPLSCIDIGNAKYRIDIKDLETNVRWTFSNYQPTTARPMSAYFEMIIQINTNSTPAKYEGGYIQLDEYHKAILTANIELDTSNAKLQNEMFCGEGPECAYENCIKGPGQAYATCQKEECTYTKPNSETCIENCECASSECHPNSKKCTGTPPIELLSGQPCKEDSDCISGICAINKRCSDHDDFAHLTGKITDKNTGTVIGGAIVEIPLLARMTTTDSDGDYAITNIELSMLGRTLPMKVTKTDYNDAGKMITLRKGDTTQQDVEMTPA